MKRAGVRGVSEHGGCDFCLELDRVAVSLSGEVTICDACARLAVGVLVAAKAPQRYAIPPSEPQRACRTCTKPIYWVVTAAGKRMPVDPDGVSHFATCQDAAQHRRARA
jgi:hypothetical protein